MKLLAVMTAIFAATPCAAQTDPSGPPGRPSVAADDGVSVTVGIAPVFSPAWQGSSDATLSIFPDLRLNYGDVLFASIPDGLGWNAIKIDGWRAGPLVKLRFGRGEEDGGSPFLVAGGSNALLGMGNISATAEVGGFAEKRFGRQREWRARAELRRGFGGHEGVLLDGSLSRQVRVAGAIINFGPRVTAASQDFMQAYFGIDAGQSARTGLARYNAKGGILSYGMGGTVIRPLTPRSALTLFTSLENLGEEPGNSPLVEERGRRAQYTLGIGYGFRLGL